jgi:hypothetical protein
MPQKWVFSEPTVQPTQRYRAFRTEECTMSADTEGFEFGRAENNRAFDRRSSKQRPDRGHDINIALELPPPGAMRWGVRSKAAVVMAVRQGTLTLDEACQRYALSVAEYISWERGLDSFGLGGLGLAGRQLHRRSLTHSEK